MTGDDVELLREYALTNSERAFAALVSRHIDLVHSVAMRQVGDSHWAEDITQAVFILLARKAKSLSKDTVLSGWLCRTARFISADAIKAQRRRQFRETEVQMESALSEPDPSHWRQIAPLLDEALDSLPEKEHDAVVLRFFEGKKLRELGLAMGTGEDAARMCVNRGLEKLRQYFMKRGVALSAATIATAISGHAVQAAPAGLAGAVTVAAATGATLSAATLAATKGLAMTSLPKTCIVSLAAILTGTGIYEALKVTRWEADVRALRLQQGPLVEKLQQLQSRLRDTTNQWFEANRRWASLSSIQNATDLVNLRGEAGLLRRQLAVLKTEADSRAAGYPKMFSDPATKRMMHQADLVGFQSMYAPLFAELKLESAEAEKAVQVIADVVEAQSEKWFVLPQGSLSSDEIAQAAAERESEWEKRLRPLLGEEGWTRFREFQAEIPAKATVHLLDGDLGAHQLNEEQRTKLEAAIKAEPFELIRGAYGDWDPAFWGSQDYIDNHLVRVADSNERILEQTRGILDAEQLKALATVLHNGITTRVTMAAALIRKP